MTAPAFTAEQLHEFAVMLRSQGLVCSPLPPYRCPAATAASVLNRTVRALKQWRAEGKGPSPITFDGRVEYDLADLLIYKIHRSHAEF